MLRPIDLYVWRRTCLCDMCVDDDGSGSLVRAHALLDTGVQRQTGRCDEHGSCETTPSCVAPVTDG